MMTASPLVAVVLGLVFLGEPLTPVAMLGIAMTLQGFSGSSWSGHRVLPPARPIAQPACARRGSRVDRGGLSGRGFCSSVEWAMGWKGMTRLTPQAATFVRMIFGGLGMADPLFYWLHRKSPSRDRRGAHRVAEHGLRVYGDGAVVGPYLGVWMSLTAMDRILLGIAQTLCSLSPVLILPVVAVIYKERVTRRVCPRRRSCRCWVCAADRRTGRPSGVTRFGPVAAGRWYAEHVTDRGAIPLRQA